MSTLRSLKRNVAKNRMKLMGFKRINRRLSAHWRDIGAPDYVKRLERRYNTTKATIKEEN